MSPYVTKLLDKELRSSSHAHAFTSLRLTAAAGYRSGNLLPNNFHTQSNIHIHTQLCWNIAAKFRPFRESLSKYSAAHPKKALWHNISASHSRNLAGMFLHYSLHSLKNILAVRPTDKQLSVSLSVDVLSGDSIFGETEIEMSGLISVPLCLSGCGRERCNFLN